MQAVQRDAMASQVVVDTGQQQRTAPVLPARDKFVPAQPDGGNDAGVQRVFRVFRTQPAGEGKAQVGDGRGVHAGRHQVDPEQGGGLEIVTGLLQRFADGTRCQAFAEFQVASGLVQAQPVGRVFLDEQEAAVAFDHRRDGDMGFPDSVRHEITEFSVNTVNLRQQSTVAYNKRLSHAPVLPRCS